MNLSRTAKKLRAQMPKPPAAPEPVRAKKGGPPPAPAPQPVVEPPVEPVPEPEATVAAEPPPPVQPKKARPVKDKRPRFVRAKTEKREHATGPALPPRSTKFAAQLLTKNLSLPPKDEALKARR